MSNEITSTNEIVESNHEPGEEPRDVQTDYADMVALKPISGIANTLLVRTAQRAIHVRRDLIVVLQREIDGFEAQLASVQTTPLAGESRSEECAGSARVENADRQFASHSGCAGEPAECACKDGASGEDESAPAAETIPAAN